MQPLFAARAAEKARSPPRELECPTANIDVWLVTFHRDFHPTSILMRTLDLFMP